MAKLTRTALKSIVKECLVEILAEGLASSGETINESLNFTEKPPPPRPKSKSKRSSHLDSINFGQKQAPERLLKEISAVTTDPLMADLLKDTAQNTFMSQMGAEKNMSYVQRVSQGDQATKAMAAADPLDLFEGACNWATLAFSHPKNSN